MSKPSLAALPTPGPDLSALPVRVDRRTGAKLVRRWFFPVSPRTVEAWPLRVRRVNGKATIETTELFALAQSKLDCSPVIRGGRKPKVTRSQPGTATAQ